MDQRPDPEQLLRRVQAEEAASRRGKLKLFFGASPGVGKTYSMLESARNRKREGVDVVVGLVETHGRAETAALLDGLDVIPRKKIDYKGVILEEFDLDAVLARKPKLVLVDELAHTNAPGSRHAKRWQDVEELLDAGINVYTALNVQHWESLNDVVAQITGAVVRETVPDTFLSQAHDVELVDLPPEELLQRLKDGKVYRGELAGRAAENFFKPGNLLALRELALRHAAERVDAQMQAFKERHAIDQVWQVGDRILVAVSTSPMSARLVRATARIARRLHSEWIVAHVETSTYRKLSDEEKNRVTQTLRLAQELGGKTVSLIGDNVTDEILNYARARNVTRIVLGKPARPRWKEWIQGSIINDLARRAGDIDLYVISGVGPTFSSRRSPPTKEEIPWNGLAWSIALVAIETLIGRGLLNIFDRTNLAMIYLLGLVGIAYKFGRRPALFASVLSVLCFDFFLVPPYFTFAVSDTQYFLTFLVMLVVGIVISTMTGRLLSQTEALRRRGLETESLYNLSREISQTPHPSDLIHVAARHLSEFFKADVLILIPAAKGNSLEVGAGEGTGWGLDDRERSTAQWVFDHGEAAGSGTQTLAGSTGLFWPLRGLHGIVGVLGLRAPWTSQIAPEREQQLESFAGEIAGALESTRLTEEAGRAEAQIDLERLRNLILSTFSYDLREPLSSILTRCDALLKTVQGSESDQIREIRKLAERLKVSTEELPQIIETEIESGDRRKSS